jgi:hypothetical protein
MQRLAFILIPALVLGGVAASARTPGYPVVDTAQRVCFDADSPIPCPEPGEPFYGQDAQYAGNAPRYKDNGDGTVSDLVTGLMWVKARGRKAAWDDALRGASECRAGGYSDWRMPSIKELYSLIDFTGWARGSASESMPFIDTRYFDFEYGNESRGERYIDCQDWSATEYRGATMGGAATVFGVNFADGRIKGYPKSDPRKGDKELYARYVRGNPDYGENEFEANADVVRDRATGLTWQREDSGRGLDWRNALAYCENLSLAGRTDWRLPGAKELQSIVDYTRGPAYTGTAAIDPVFGVSEIESYYWAGTTHLDGPAARAASNAVYVAFGRAMGYMRLRGMSGKELIDVHGAGAQRSDPKSGDPRDYPQGFGPQGDDRRIYNFVRCVAGGAAEPGDPPASARIELERLGVGQGSGRGLPPQGQDREDEERGDIERRRGGSGIRRGPPPEAQAACRGKDPGQGCSFRAPHGTVRGACARMGDALACVPGPKSEREFMRKPVMPGRIP